VICFLLFFSAMACAAAAAGNLFSAVPESSTSGATSRTLVGAARAARGRPIGGRVGESLLTGFIETVVRPQFVTKEGIPLEAADRDEEIDQGGGDLDDRTTAVVESRHGSIGRTIKATARSTPQAEAGRTLFAELPRRRPAGTDQWKGGRP